MVSPASARRAQTPTGETVVVQQPSVLGTALGLALGGGVRTDPPDPNPLLFPSLVRRSLQEWSLRAEGPEQRAPALQESLDGRARGLWTPQATGPQHAVRGRAPGEA